MSVLTLLVLLPGRGVQGQELRARLRDAGSGAPVVGAFATLEEAGGTDGKTGKAGSREAGERPGKGPGRVAGLTDSLGWVRLRARERGRYVLRVEQLGYRTFVSDTILLDTVVVRQISVAAEAIALPALAAVSRRKCGGADPLAAEAAVIWEEVRKALAVTSWTTSERSVSYIIREYSRQLNPRNLAVLDESSSQELVQTTGSPFVSLGPQDLSERGFIRATERGDYQYYGPDSDVILSSWFQERHCFHAVSDAKRPGLIGLGFEPGPDAPRYDIRGVLWLDRQSSELRYLEYNYSALPVSTNRGNVGGRVDFERLGSGRWIVRGWWIRAPMLGSSVGPGAARSVPALQEVGRTVVSVHERGIGGDH